MTNNGGQQERSVRSGELVNVLYIAISAHEFCVTPFLRYGIGPSHPGVAAVFSVGMMLGLLCETRDSMVLVYFGLWFVMLALRRMQTLLLMRKGPIHSRFGGHSWLEGKIPWLRSNKHTRLFVEPMTCAIIGLLLCPLSTNLGKFLMLEFITLLIKHALDSAITQLRIQRMIDAELEMQYFGDLLKKKKEKWNG